MQARAPVVPQWSPRSPGAAPHTPEVPYRRSSDHLTDRGIRSFKALEGKRVELMDSAVPGLGVRVLPTGRKSWFLRYGPREARRRIVLGPYPAVSLEAARDKARELVSGVKIGGRDPMAEREAERTARRKEEAATFGFLAACYLEEHAKRNKRLRAWKEDERKLSVEVLPVWGSRPAAEIRQADAASCSKRSRSSGRRLRQPHPDPDSPGFHLRDRERTH